MHFAYFFYVPRKEDSQVPDLYLLPAKSVTQEVATCTHLEILSTSDMCQAIDTLRFPQPIQ